MVARAPCKVRQHDVTRALRAVKASGEIVDRLEVYPGKFVIVIGRGDDSPVDALATSPPEDIVL